MKETVDPASPDRQRFFHGRTRTRLPSSGAIQRLNRQGERVEKEVACRPVPFDGDSHVSQFYSLSLLLDCGFGRFFGEESQEQLGGSRDDEEGL